MKSLEDRRAQLEARRAELQARLGRIESELEEPLSEDFAEQAVEREDDEVLEDLGAAGQQEIRAIDAALGRIEDGTYGTCERCGRPISAGRLEARPTARTCIDCAAR